MKNIRFVSYKYPSNRIFFKIGPFNVVHDIKRVIGITWDTGYIGIMLTHPNVENVERNEAIINEINEINYE